MLFDKSLLQQVIAAYKDVFVSKQWPNEKYKWIAVKHFQDNWDIDAPDFVAMLKTSLAKTGNLLVSVNNFPARMITEFAEADPEKIRAMFNNLFDESKNLNDRIKQFKNDSEVVLKKYAKPGAHHYQNENSITTYLWLRYPEKYYIYKYSEVKSVVEKLQSNCIVKKGSTAENLRVFMELYNAIRQELLADDELKALLKSQLTEDCYADEALCTLTIDFGFYISRRYGNESDNEINNASWFPTDYTPDFTVEDWVKLLKDPEVFTTSNLEIMARFQDFGGVATCKQLSDKYGESANFYNSGSSYLAKRIHEKTNCPVMAENTENSRWWPILYLGRYNEDKNVSGVYIWKLRPELAEALKQVDLSAVKLYADDKQISDNTGSDNVNYWWLNANPKMWSMSAAPVGEVQDYTLYNDNQHKRRVFQNFLDAKVGDMIIGYESTPVKQIVALFQISKEQDGERIYFKKIEHLAVPIDLATLQTQPELAEMEFFKNSQASLLKLSAAEYDCIINLIRDVNPLPQVRNIEEYDAKNFLSEVFMNREKYDSLVHILQAKKNIILQGAPGVGKTFAARRLAYSIMGVKDDSRIEFVQFHQNYSYEDFVMGYKPNENGFELKNGIFYSFCQKAASAPDKDYFFIIDEINRGNMSKIFGELLMLIEKDYRDTSLTLAYDGRPFFVPKNLHIIGMMNTADRSLAMIDYALRRRFSFFDMEPGFDSAGFIAYQQKLNSEKLDRLVAELKSLNNAIIEDKSLGKGFCIGHSYLCGEEICTDEWLRGVVEYDILPMLAEYWFDELDKYEEWKKRLTDAVK